MKQVQQFIVVATLSLFATAAWGTNYYVDCTVGSNTNPGTAPGTGNAWKSIKYAAQHVGSQDVVHVRTGTNGACEENTISFTSSISGQPGCLTDSTKCTIFQGESSSGTGTTIDVRPPALVGGGQNGDGFIFNRDINNVKFIHFRLASNGTTVYNDPLQMRGTESNMVFSIMSVEGKHGSGWKISGGYGGTHDIRIEHSAAHLVQGNGFLLTSAAKVCSMDQTIVCTTDAGCTGHGVCGRGDIYNVTFLDTIALDNKVPDAQGVLKCGSDGGADGFASSPSTTDNTVYNITFDKATASGNGEDGFDIVAKFQDANQNPTNQVTTFLDVQSASNCARGLVAWHSAHIENAWISNNPESGIRTVRITSDHTTAAIDVISSTVTNNASTGGSQISLDGRDQYAKVKLYDTIASSTNTSASNPDSVIALQYSTANPSTFSIEWDWNLLWRLTRPPPTCGATQSCSWIVKYASSSGCSSSQITTCNGSHPNSKGQAPVFASSQYQDPTSPAWDAGVKPSLIVPTPATIYRADATDNQGNVRPYPTGGAYDMGAFEGPPPQGGCTMTGAGGSREWWPGAVALILLVLRVRRA